MRMRLRLENRFCPAIFAIVEIFVRIGGFVQFQLVRNYHRGLRFSSGNQIAKFSVVIFHVCLARPDFLSLEPERSEIERDFPLLGELVFRARIYGNENTDYSKS